MSTTRHGAISSEKMNNFEATSAPTATDDVSGGYAKGSVWLDVSAGKVYFCTDPSDDAAVWVELSESVGIHTDTSAPGASDDETDGHAVGTVWVDTTNDRAYIAVDVTEDAAVWRLIGGGGVYEFAASADRVYDQTAGVWSPNTPFVGTCNGDPPSSTSVPYNHTSGENSMGPGMVLHNPTKSEKCYITAVNQATNTITVEANSPDDCSTWDNGDAITTASQVNTGRSSAFCDIDITNFVTSGTKPTGCIINFTVLLQNSDTYHLVFHPYEAYDVDKEMAVDVVSSSTVYKQRIVPVTEDEHGRFYFTIALINLSSNNAYIMFRWGGQFTQW